MRIITFIAVCFCVASSAFAQNFELKRYSSISDGDYQNKFSGVATAIYIGNVSDVDEHIELIKSVFPDSIRGVSKLTKNNAWLCKKAMSEWEYQANEYYFVILADSVYSDNFILLLVTTESPENYSWCGWVLTEDDLPILTEAFEAAVKD